MLFEFRLQSAILLIFFVHGLIYSLLVLRKSQINESTSDKWLSAFLLLCTLYIMPWMVGFAGWYTKQPYRDILFYTPFQHLFLFGPVLFFYIQSLLNPSRYGGFEWQRPTVRHSGSGILNPAQLDFLHFIPAVLYFLYCVVMVVTDKLVLGEYYFLKDGSDRDFDNWYQVTGFVSMMVYLVLSLRYYNAYKKLMVQTVSYADQVLFRWVRNFLVAFMVILGLRFGFLLLAFITNFSYGNEWWYYLTFSVVFYYIAISGYSNSIENKISFRSRFLASETSRFGGFEIARRTVRYSENGTVRRAISNPAQLTPEPDMAGLDDWKEKVLKAVVEEKKYQDPELNLPDLADYIGTSSVWLSKVINQGFEQNFNDFINFYRVEAVKTKILAGEAQKITLLGIAYDCGFNSKATFNRAFKKFTDQSPKEFMQG